MPGTLKMIDPVCGSTPPGWLGMWYAEPMQPGQARILLGRASYRMHRWRRCGHHCVTGRLQILVAHYWMGVGTPQDYDMAVHAAFRNRRAAALAELVYGQLLLSRKLASAFDHLDAGFLLAAPVMTAGDYLDVRRRHDLLRRIELGNVPSPALGLADLMVEAAVISRLEGRLPQQFRHDPSDTSG